MHDSKFFKVHPSFVSKMILFANLYENADHWILLFLDWSHFEVRKDRPFQNMTLWQDKFRAQASAGLFFCIRFPIRLFHLFCYWFWKMFLAVFFPGLYSLRQNWSVLKICKRKMLCFSILDNVISQSFEIFRRKMWRSEKMSNSTWCFDKIYHKTTWSFNI